MFCFSIVTWEEKNEKWLLGKTGGSEILHIVCWMKCLTPFLIWNFFCHTNSTINSCEWEKWIIHFEQKVLL